MTAKKVEIQWYVCAFIDILGQRDQLKKLEGRPLGADFTRDPEVRQLLLHTYKCVDDLHRGLEGSWQAFRRGVGKSVPTAHREYWRRVTKYKPRIVHFSDGIMFAIPLALKKELLPIHGLAGLISVCGHFLLLQLAKEAPIRGGITVGHAAQLSYDVLFGPVVAKAHDLESTVAGYPRVVVGDDLLKYLEGHEHITPDEIRQNPVIRDPDMYAALTNRTAALCKRLLFVDSDGQVAVHWLNPFILGSGAVPHMGKILDAAESFIGTQLQLWERRQNQKLLSRYRALAAYFDEHIQEARASLSPPDSRE